MTELMFMPGLPSELFDLFHQEKCKPLWASEKKLFVYGFVISVLAGCFEGTGAELWLCRTVIPASLNQFSTSAFVINQMLDFPITSSHLNLQPKQSTPCKYNKILSLSLPLSPPPPTENSTEDEVKASFLNQCSPKTDWSASTLLNNSFRV